MKTLYKIICTNIDDYLATSDDELDQHITAMRACGSEFEEYECGVTSTLSNRSNESEDVALCVEIPDELMPVAEAISGDKFWRQFSAAAEAYGYVESFDSGRGWSGNYRFEKTTEGLA